MFNITVKGIASHGGMTGFNNLDFWKENEASDHGLDYEAYDWFDKTFYISDSDWTKWKCYDKGKLLRGNDKPPSEHLHDEHNLLYLLIHSDTYYKDHFYE